MPSLTTHFVFSEDLYNKFDQKTKERIKDSKLIYNIFAQSHDLLFYYFFDTKNGKIIRDLGHHAHHNKTQDYLINIIKEIKTNKLENNSNVMAYLYGVITHYVLDNHCHPYIFYKTGVFRKKHKWTHKYYGEHTHIEKDLDAIYYYKHFNKPYNKANLNKEVIQNIEINKELQTLISTVYQKTYGIENVGNKINKCIKLARLANTLVVHDRFGIKKALFNVLNVISFNKLKKLTFYSDFMLKTNKQWLNEERKEWNHPCYKDIKYHDSFEDLYNKGLNDALIIINTINKYLYDKESLQKLKEVIPNIDYGNGLDCDDPTNLNYFEY